MEKELDYSQKQNEKDTFVFKCDSCGSNLEFNPKGQNLICPHCNTEKDFEKSRAIREIEIVNAFNVAPTWQEDNLVYRCENCGAVVVLNKFDVATLCPYCSTSNIVISNEMAGLKPNALYPYTITNGEALSLTKAWAKKRLFAPRKFKKTLNADNVKGVYEPCFTYDSKTFSTYAGRLGRNRQRTVIRNGKRYTETYTEWFNVSGTYSLNFDDVFINNSHTLTQNSVDKLQPYDIETITDYDKTYLAGYMAKRGEKTVDAGWEEAKNVMDASIRSHILSQYDYNTVNYLNVSTTHQNVTYKYVLLPVYYVNFKYHKKIYSSLVNGNTGKIVGKTPKSWVRILAAVLLGVGVVAGLLFLISNLL